MAIEVKSKCDQVMEQIIQDIKNGVFEPGQKVPSETELAERFGVSRITIRESFKKLSILNIVDIRQGEGTYICSLEPSSFLQVLFPVLKIDEASVEDLFDARLIIERGMVGFVVERINDAQMDELDEHLAIQKEVLLTREVVRYSELDTSFHKLLGVISQNATLQRIYDIIEGMLSECIMKISRAAIGMDISFKRHKILVECIRRKDIQGALQTITDHINTSKILLLEQMAKNGN